MLSSGEPFILGVNYWPRRKAMYWWRDFDAGEVREEFAIIRDLGMTIVRIFLLWDDFQPASDQVSAEALKNLVKVADIAAELGLGLDITFFTGHMSGPNWSPGWLRDAIEQPSPHIRQVVSDARVVDGGYRNMFSDAVSLAAERILLREVATALQNHPGVAWWNLGNEPDLFAWPADAAAGQAWVREMSGIIRSIDPRPVTCGLHSASLLENNGLRVDQVYAESDFGVMHSYPMYMHWLDNPLDPDFVPYTVALTAALSGKPCLMEEFGGCTAPPGEDSQMWDWVSFGKPRKQFMASEEALAEYLRLCLPKLVEIGSPGAMVWCFADYIPELWDRPPCDEAIHERHFGLVRSDGSLKPHALTIKEFAASKPVVQPIPEWARLAASADDYYRAPAENLKRLWDVYHQQMTAANT
jgi:endo-1,4-beta-mannosidase